MADYKKPGSCRLKGICKSLAKCIKYAKEEVLPFYSADFKCRPGFEKECVRKKCAFKTIVIFLLLIYENINEKSFIKQQKQKSIKKICNNPIPKNLNKQK